jgi:riboflavin synthase
MFTGIIQGLGEVKKIYRMGSRGRAAQLTVKLGRLSRGLKVGDSVSVNGACLTVTRLQGDQAIFEMVDETMRRTALGSLSPGDMVNIERSLRVGDAIDGHFVLGHVDSVGKVVNKVVNKGEIKLWVSLDKKLLEYVVEKGSIAIDGVSLTVVDVGRSKFSVVLIPHTIQMTTLGNKSKGDWVNVEIDVLGRYARKLLAAT